MFGARTQVIFVAIVVALIIISQLLLSANPKVVVLSSANSKVFLQSTSTYQRAATKLFTAHISNRNKLTVNVAAISSDMKNQFPELSDVSVALPFIGSRPTVYIQPAEPAFVLHTANGKFFVLDGSGRAEVAASNAQITALNIPTITDESGLQVGVGGIALPGTDVAFIQTVVSQLSAQHVSIRKIVLPPVASELDVYIAGKPYFVKFDMHNQNTALQQAGTFIATADQLAAQGTTPSRYVDVRIEGRAYYK